MEQKSVRSVVPPLLWSMAAALVALVVAVWPAEYGVDPTGLGKAMGLTALSDPPSHAHEIQSGAPIDHTASFTLEPFESLEYKLVLEEDAGIVYAWRATADVEFDMHAEPEDGPEGFAETFSAGSAAGQSAVHVPPFAGEHGWYWQNRSTSPVVITLDVAGFFTRAVEYRGGMVITHELAERKEGSR